MIPPRLDRDYDSATTGASRSVLLEVMTILGEYRDALVLIGGWGPYFLLPQGPASARRQNREQTPLLRGSDRELIRF
ncbi:MAG: hypothetical protein HY748_09490 [Elusimicrobia bacterium]|nr:hypothetical protein [Elusimicrobiota bacterium]